MCPYNKASKAPAVLVVDPSCYSPAYDHSFCTAIAKRGCEVTLARSEFLYDEWPSVPQYTSWQGFYKKSHGRGKTGSFWKVAKGLEHVWDMKEFVKEAERSQPDIIHFQWLPLPMVDRLFLPRLARICPLVVTLHNTTFSRCGTVSRLQHETGFRPSLNHFQAIIVHSDFSRRKVEELGWASSDRVHVVPHGPLDYYRTLPDPPAPVTDERRVLFFGRVEHSKGLDVLLQAFAAIPDRVRSTIRLYIAGQPNGDCARLQAMAKDLGITDRVVWDLRFIPEREVPALFQAATVVVLPYREIDQSGVLMTAIAFERAVVATRVGGIAETIRDGEHGLLVEPEDVSGLANAISELVVASSRRAAMERAVGDLRKGALSWESAAETTLDIYHGLRTSKRELRQYTH